MFDVPSVIAEIGRPSRSSKSVFGPSNTRMRVVPAGAGELGVVKTSGIRAISALLCGLSHGSFRWNSSNRAPSPRYGKIATRQLNFASPSEP